VDDIVGLKEFYQNYIMTRINESKESNESSSLITKITDSEYINYVFRITKDSKGVPAGYVTISLPFTSGDFEKIKNIFKIGKIELQRRREEHCNLTIHEIFIKFRSEPLNFELTISKLEDEYFLINVQYYRKNRKYEGYYKIDDYVGLQEFYNTYIIGKIPKEELKMMNESSLPTTTNNLSDNVKYNIPIEELNRKVEDYPLEKFTTHEINTIRRTVSNIKFKPPFAKTEQALQLDINRSILTTLNNGADNYTYIIPVCNSNGNVVVSCYLNKM